MLHYTEIELLPQISGVCWFVSILTVLLYSEGLRIIIKKQLSISLKLDRSNLFLKILKYIVDNNYTNQKNIINLLKGNFTVEFLLFDYIFYYRKIYLENTLKLSLNINFKYLGYYYELAIISILKDLKINFKDLYHFNNNIYENILSDKKDVLNISDNRLDTTKTIFPEPPDILLLFVEPLLSFTIDRINDSSSIIPEGNYKDIKEHKETVYLNDIKYKLESCILHNNYVKGTRNHVIAGITYNNTSFIYNGWTTKSETKSLVNSKKTCKLFNRDWKEEINKNTYNFCIDSDKCNLPITTSESGLCFNFSKGNKVLIYVKVKELEEEKQEKQEEVFTLHSIESTQDTINYYLGNYYNFNSRTIVYLKEQLMIIDYDKIIYLYLTYNDILNNLEDKYKRLFSLDFTKTEEELIKAFYIKLLEKYIIHKHVYDYFELFKINEKSLIVNITKEYLLYLNIETIEKIYNYLYKDNITIELDKDNPDFYIDDILIAVDILKLKDELIKIGYDKLTVNKITSKKIKLKLKDKYKSVFNNEGEDDVILLQKFLKKLIDIYNKSNYVYNYIELFKISKNDLPYFNNTYLNTLNNRTLANIYENLTDINEGELNLEVVNRFRSKFISDIIIAMYNSISKDKLLMIGYDKLTVNNITSRNILLKLKNEHKLRFDISERNPVILLQKFIEYLLDIYENYSIKYHYIDLFEISDDEIRELDIESLKNLYSYLSNSQLDNTTIIHVIKNKEAIINYIIMMVRGLKQQSRGGNKKQKLKKTKRILKKY